MRSVKRNHENKKTAIGWAVWIPFTQFVTQVDIGA